MKNNIKYKLEKGQEFNIHKTHIELSDLLSAISEEYREIIKDIIMATDADSKRCDGLSHAYKIINYTKEYVQKLLLAIYELDKIRVEYRKSEYRKRGEYLDSWVISAIIKNDDVIILDFTYPAMNSMKGWQREIEEERAKVASKNKALDIIKTDVPAGLDEEIAENFNDVNLFELISNAFLGVQE